MYCSPGSRSRSTASLPTLFSPCLWHNSNLLSTFASASPYILYLSDVRSSPLSVRAPWGWCTGLQYMYIRMGEGSSSWSYNHWQCNIINANDSLRVAQGTIVAQPLPRPFFLHSAETFVIVVPVLKAERFGPSYKTVIKRRRGSELLK